MASPLEKTIENYVVCYAQKRGVFVTKLASPGQRGMPDRAFWFPHRHLLLIEFKRPGSKLTELQKHAHKRLKGLGYDVRTIETRAAGIEVINHYIAGSCACHR